MKTNMICFNCRKEVPTKIVEEMETYNVKGTNISLMSNKRICSCCGEEIFDKELDSITLFNAYEKYKKINGFLTSKEIIDLRKKYSISQKALSKLLGWGEKTITRYENGSIQDKTHDSILKSIVNRDGFIRIWDSNKHVLSYREISKIEEKLYPNINTLNTFYIRVYYKKKRPYNLSININNKENVVDCKNRMVMV